MTSGTGLLTPGKFATEDIAAPPVSPSRLALRRRQQFSLVGVAYACQRSAFLRRYTARVITALFPCSLVPRVHSELRRTWVDGLNRRPAVHRLDAAVVYRLALEKSAGVCYHAVAEAGITFREIASAIGRRLNLRVPSKTGKQANEHFGWFAQVAAGNLPASSETGEGLGRQPRQPGLLAEVDQPYYFAASVASVA